MAYSTVAELKLRLDITDTVDDAALADALSAAEKAIDRFCGRTFGSATQTRYYTPRSSRTLAVQDLVTVTTIKTDEDADGTYETTWAATDYTLEPYNAATDGEPYTDISITSYGSNTFPVAAKSVQIVGSFGWPSVPIEVSEATLLMASRLWKRADSPFGVAGNTEMGEIRILPRLDPDVRTLLEPLRNPRMMVG